ncbi:MAG: M15 family metallopeptidase [Dorea sp.]|jgi:D-alanyl-D-alanine carboxypeptidase|nr:M15 family metallopeptidase [Dorea sp.]
MTGKYVQNGYSRKIYRSRRKKRRMRLIGLTFILILVCILTVGFVWMTVAETEEPSHTGYEAENYSPQVSGTQDMPWYLTLINKENYIPGDYKPELVELKGGECVDKRIYDPLTEMLEAAKEGNLDQLPEVVSGYRTSDKQQKIYDEKIEKYKKEGYSEDEARELAKQWVAVPGYSEHQLGIAVDINGATYDVYSWLQENSYRYGFIFRYPGDKTEMTGIAEEVWHYRYVGVEAATEMYEKGLCLEEYLENI